jgi:hypothetical protein
VVCGSAVIGNNQGLIGANWRYPPTRKGAQMAAMKPRTGDGPLEVTKEGRSYVMRVPLEGGGRLVVELNGDEVKELGEALLGVFA